jgi:glycosyltransferase involved in cell wall biosynthesis
MKFVVAQIGARRGYAVPAILEEAGMLERFYTDMTGDISLGRFLSSASLLPVIGKPARRLAARQVPQNIRAKTTTFSGLSLTHILRRTLRTKPVAVVRESLRFSTALGHAMTRKGFGNATHLYSMFTECGPVIKAAKQRGLTVVSEVYIPLSTERILAKERKQFPDWELNVPDFAAVRREYGFEDLLFTSTDFVICPSDAVRDDLVDNFGFMCERTRIVPYGMNPALLSMRNQPVRGRVLFAGTAELRKGIQYFAMAAENLVSRGGRYEFRVAGNVQRSVANQRVCRHLTFLGRIPRVNMAREFAAADVFVLPSLAEGAPEVNYEALACGVPVITTPEAKAAVRDQIEGRIVPSRDPEALADAITEVVEDRQKRERMAAAARERARDFTWQRYGERLIAALIDCSPPTRATDNSNAPEVERGR